jgi:transcription initiation factor TFIID TATA-box-binding protein
MKIREFGGKKIVISKSILKSPTVVASASLDSPVDLEKAASQLNNAIYEPEQFPGLIIHTEKPKGMILLFASGKFVCTATNEQDIYDAILQLKAGITP